jgi:gamma-butyrobetaine dioxygenase
MTNGNAITSAATRTASTAPAAAFAADGDLHLRAGGRLLRYPAIWLRHNCPCPDCRDPVTTQRLPDITDLPPGCAVVSAAVSRSSADAGAGEVRVTFGPDGHRAAFAIGWLAAHRLDGYDDGDGQRRMLWHSAAELRELPRVSWARYAADPAERRRALDAVRQLGFVLLRGVRTEPGMVLEVAGSFGYVRETNYGRLFDVRIEPAPDNLGFTSRELYPHTDNPYRDPVPTVQLLHCLKAADEGGETILVDGFAAAAALHASDPEEFGLLASTTLRYSYSDQTAALTSGKPLIELGPRGQVAAVRYNSRSVGPVRLPYGEVAAFYRAWRKWGGLLRDPGRQVRLSLSPGDCLIFDNTRVLHARTAYSVTGGRHLQGCYADMDGLASTARLLRQREAG